MSVRADKIVAGKAITMGEGPWKWDAAKSELRWDMPRQVWVLKVGDREIAGTLTLADGSVVRRMKLVRGE